MEDNINNISIKHVKATSPLCRGSYSIVQRQLFHCAEEARCAEAATPLCRGS